VQDHGQAVRILIRQGTQQDGVHHAEDRGVGTDTQGERDDSDSGEARPLSQHAESVANVLKPTLHEVSPDAESFLPVVSLQVFHHRKAGKPL